MQIVDNSVKLTSLRDIRFGDIFRYLTDGAVYMKTVDYAMCVNVANGKVKEIKPAELVQCLAAHLVIDGFATPCTMNVKENDE